MSVALMVASVLPTSYEAEAQSLVTPCLQGAAPCLRPGEDFLGDNQVPILGVGTYNSHSRDTSYFGPAITPAGGYLRIDGADVVVVASSGLPTRFVKAPGSQSSAPLLSIDREVGDRREVSRSGGTYTLYDPLTGIRFEFGYTYRGIAYPTSIKNEYGFVTLAISYKDGVPVSSLNQAGGETKYYGSNGRVTSISHPLGYSIGLKYDQQGRLSQVFIGSRAVQTMHYDQSGKMTDIVDDEGAMALFAYKGDVLVGIGDEQGASIAIEYASSGVTYKTTYPGGAAVTRVAVSRYKDRYLVDRVSHAPSSGGELLPFAAITRDSVGNVLNYVDELGRSQWFTYQDGLPVSDSGGEGTITWKRDSAGRIVSETEKSDTNALIRSTSFSYVGDLIAQVVVNDPSGAKVAETQFTYTRNSDGSVRSFTESSSGQESFAYDALSRVVKANGPYGSVGVSRDSTGQIRSLTVNGIKTSIDETFANGESRSTFQGPSLAGSYVSNILGTKESTMVGNPSGKSVSTAEGSFNGTILGGSSAFTSGSTFSHSDYSLQAWAARSPYRSSSSSVSGPGNAPAGWKPNLRDSQPYAEEGNRGGGAGTGGATSGSSGSGTGSCCPVGQICKLGMPTCGGGVAGGAEGDSTGGSTGSGSSGSGSGSCCPVGQICKLGMPTCEGGSSGGQTGGSTGGSSGSGSSGSGSGSCCPVGQICKLGMPTCEGGSSGGQAGGSTGGSTGSGSSGSGSGSCCPVGQICKLGMPTCGGGAAGGAEGDSTGGSTGSGSSGSGSGSCCPVGQICKLGMPTCEGGSSGGRTGGSTGGSTGSGSSGSGSGRCCPVGQICALGMPTCSGGSSGGATGGATGGSGGSGSKQCCPRGKICPLILKLKQCS